MKVEIEGARYHIRFQHGETQWLLNPSRSVREELARHGVLCTRASCGPVALPRRTTVCFIEREDDEFVLEVSAGQAVCNPVDHYTKESGRRIALKRALGALPVQMRGYSGLFMEAYQNRGNHNQVTVVPA